MKKRIIGALLIISVLLNLLPVFASADNEIRLSEPELGEEITLAEPMADFSGSRLAQSGESRPAFGVGQELLGQYFNTSMAAKVWFGFYDTEAWDNKGHFYVPEASETVKPACWRVVSYEGEGVAGYAGRMTLLAESYGSQSLPEYGSPIMFGNDNRYYEGPLRTKTKDSYGFASYDIWYYEQSYEYAHDAYGFISDRILLEDDFKLLPPYCDGVRGEAPLYSRHDYYGESVWSLSSAEAYKLDPSLRLWSGGAWWLRSPGVSSKYAAYVDLDGGLNVGGQLGTLPIYKMRAACHFKPEWVGTVTAADNSEHKAFGKVGTYDGSVGYKIGLYNSWPVGWGRDWFVYYDSVFEGLSGNAVLPVGYTGETYTIKHFPLKDMGRYDHITVALSDENGEVLYYGSINTNEDDRQSSVSIPDGLAKGTYTLTVSYEMWNDAYLIDLVYPDRLTQEITVTDYGIQITKQPEDLTVSSGSGKTLKVEAKEINGAALSYQWYACSPNGQWRQKLEGATENEYQIPTGLVAGDYYYLCRVSPRDTTQTAADVETNVVKAEVSGNFGDFHVENNSGVGDLTGVEYDNGVLTLTTPGSFTVSQSGGPEAATADRIVIELPTKEDKLTLVLEGVNIKAPGAESHSALTVTRGDLNLIVKDENRLEGGTGSRARESGPEAGGAGLYIDPSDGAATIKGGGDESDSLTLAGGMGGYDWSTVMTWGGGSGGCGINGVVTADGANPLELNVIGGQGGNSYSSGGGVGGFGVGGSKWSGGWLTVTGDMAEVTVAAGGNGTGDNEEYNKDDYWRYAGMVSKPYYDKKAVQNGKITVEEGSDVVAGNDEDSAKAVSKKENGECSVGNALYVKISGDKATSSDSSISPTAGFHLGMDGLERDDRVWMGNAHVTYESSRYVGPVSWLAMNEKGFLLSEDALGAYYFDSGTGGHSEDVEHFRDSDLAKKLDSLYNGEEAMFSKIEQSAIVDKTEITTRIYDPDTSEYLGHLYPLSRKELSTLDDKDTAYITGEKPASYWLRDLAADKTLVYTAEGGTTYVPFYRAVYYHGIRPAMNLDPSRVLFSSPAVGGKSEPGMTGGLISVEITGETDKKLTLLDKSRDFSASCDDPSAAPGEQIQLKYTGAEVGKNEYVSALLTGEAGEVLYYGRLTKPSVPDGQISVTLPMVEAGDYELRVFSEQRGGDYQSDYGSAFSEIQLTVEATPCVMLGADGFDGFDWLDGHSYIYFGEYNGAPIKWRILDEYFGNDGSEGTALLLSEYILTDDAVEFSYDGGSDWQGSKAQSWCGDFAEDSFSALEQDAVRLTADGGLLNDDTVFFLSKDEAQSLAYGMGNDELRKAYMRDEESQFAWWLRSADADMVDIVDVDGELTKSTANTAWAARPAFNLDHDGILFTQAADNRGHEDFGVPDNHPEGENWKLTLKDGNDFSIGASLYSDSGVTFGRRDTLTIEHKALESFTSAGYTNVTALVLDEYGQTLLYGSVNSDVSATRSTITIPAGLEKGEYSLMVFAENWNDPYYTDYGSGTPFTVTFAVVGEEPENVFIDKEVGLHMPENTKEARFHELLDLYESTLSLWPFEDVNESDWFYEAVRYVWEKELMQGTGEAAFGPELTVTRGMLAAIIYRLEGEPAVTGQCPFEDVEKGKYYENAITWAAENKIVNGYENGRFGPEDEITREQIAAILYRYADYKGLDASPRGDLTQFSDQKAVSEYAVLPLSWANAIGLIEGKPGSALDPAGKAKRCEAAAIIQRFSSYFGEFYGIILP